MSMLSDAIYMDDVPKTQWKQYGIGKGYRSVCYMTDHEKHGNIVLLGFDTNGERKTYRFPWRSYVKYNVKYKTDEKDIYGNYVATKYFNSKWERDNYVKNATGLNVVECLKPEQEFLHYMFDENVLESDFNKQKLRIQSIDIETEISDLFMPPSRAENRINMITIFDNFTEKFYTWSLDHAEVDFKEEPLKDYPKDMFVFYEFHNDESALLEHFIGWIEDNYPDVSYGWNIRQYDWPYIVRRIEEVLGKGAVQRLSPIGKYFIKQVNHDNARADVAAEIEVDISGLFIADGLVLYRDKFGIGRPDGGFTLDNIGEHEGCGHKIHYDGTLKDLYLKDYLKFYEYNVRDVDLCKRIDDKCKMIQLARQITSFGLTGYGAIYSSISYLIGSVLSFAKTQMNGKVFTSYLAEKRHFDSFEGAFVFPTQAGVYRGGTGTIDFASLYPSNIRAINASPETYVGKVLVKRVDDAGYPLPVDLDKEPAFNLFDDAVAKEKHVVGYELKLPNGQRKAVTLDWLRDIINSKCIYTTNNTLFLKHEVKWGVIAKWCEYFYGLRKSTKKKMLACDHRLHKEVDTLTEVEKEKLKTDSENYNTAQLGIKSMINSIYGCMGTSFSPIANPDIAQSVTRQGRFCNKSTSGFILKRFQELYNAPSDYKVSLGGDTDSCLEETLIRIKVMKDVEETISLGDLWNDLITKGYEVHAYKDYEVIECGDIDVLTYNNKYTNLVWLSRHKTPKHMLKISVSTNGSGASSVTVTTDHVCMTYDRDRILQNVNAQNLNVGDYVSFYDIGYDKEVLGTIENIEDLGTTDAYVYDVEVNDDKHAFYANDILVHNSQFVNLQCVSKTIADKYGLKQNVHSWPKKYKRELWDTMYKFVDEEVNPFVRNLVHDYCHTTQQNVLTYELEYMTDAGVFESMKHYAVHQCIVEGDDEDHIKYAGIELKKNQVPKEMKEFLAAIYEGVLLKEWTENDYQTYVNDLYDKFSKFSIDEISFWKGYNTERQAVGFLLMAVGTTGIAKACIYYNQIIEKMGLGKKYDELRVGDKVRLCYIKKANKYGIDVIAYKPGQWPKEFNEVFEVDYKTMFKKIILDPLKRFREACHFDDTDPSKQAQFDIFSI